MFAWGVRQRVLIRIPFRALRARKLSIVVTARADEFPAGSIGRPVIDELTGEARLTVIGLHHPLDRASAAALVRTLARTGLEADSVEALEQAAWSLRQGNPFILAEAVRALVRAVPPGERAVSRATGGGRRITDLPKTPLIVP
jgi:hypothetical protein